MIQPRLKQRTLLLRSKRIFTEKAKERKLFSSSDVAKESEKKAEKESRREAFKVTGPPDADRYFGEAMKEIAEQQKLAGQAVRKQQKEKELSDLFLLVTSSSYYFSKEEFEECQAILQEVGVDKADLMEFLPCESAQRIAEKLRPAAKGKILALLKDSKR